MRRSLTHGYSAYLEDDKCLEKLECYAWRYRNALYSKPGDIEKIRFNPTKHRWAHPYHIWILFGYGRELWFYNTEKEARGAAILKSLK